MKHQRQLQPRSEGGATLVIVTLFVAVLFGFAAFSLDYGNVLRQQREAQDGVDAGALAGAVLLSNDPQNVTLVTDTAALIADTNGVTAAEIAAGPAGAIQVGRWTNGQFEANQTINGRYTAVRVSARRTVNMNFARVVGIQAMTPKVDSVACLDYLSAAGGLRPFTISSNLLSGVLTGQVFTVDEYNVTKNNSGQWGQLDYQNTLEGSKWYDAMTSGYQGVIPLGNDYAVLGQGNNQVQKSFEYLATTGETIIIPVIDTFIGVPNNGPVNIVGFIGLRVIAYDNSGSKASITFQLKEAIGSGQGGGPPGPFFAKTRVLVGPRLE